MIVNSLPASPNQVNDHNQTPRRRCSQDAWGWKCDCSSCYGKRAGDISGRIRRLNAAERHMQVKNLHCQGESKKDIADKVGYSLRHINRILAEYIPKSVQLAIKEAFRLCKEAAQALWDTNHLSKSYTMENNRSPLTHRYSSSPSVPFPPAPPPGFCCIERYRYGHNHPPDLDNCCYCGMAEPKPDFVPEGYTPHGQERYIEYDDTLTVENTPCMHCGLQGDCPCNHQEIGYCPA